MFLIWPVMSKIDLPMRAGACAAAVLCVSAGCTSKPANPIAPIQSKSAAQLCADANYDPDVVVFQDSSSQYRLAAIGVTGSGNLDEFAAVVGQSVITTRGGATVSGGSSVDVEARSCDTYQSPTP